MKEIESLRSLGIKIAVLTNASLLDGKDVPGELAKADLVSLKVDAVSEDCWRKVNRPHRSLKLVDILEAMCSFTKAFKGEVGTLDIADRKSRLWLMPMFDPEVVDAAIKAGTYNVHVILTTWMKSTSVR